MIDENKFKLYQIACLEEQAAFNDLHSGFLLKYYDEGHNSFCKDEAFLNRPYYKDYTAISNLEFRYVEAMKKRIEAHKNLMDD